MDKNDTWDIYIISLSTRYMMKYRTQICVRLSLSCSELQQTPSGTIGLNTIQIFPYRCLCLYISLFSEIWEKLCFENYRWSPRAHSGCGHTGHNPDTDWAETGRLPPPASPPPPASSVLYNTWYQHQTCLPRSNVEIESTNNTFQRAAEV